MDEPLGLRPRCILVPPALVAIALLELTDIPVRDRINGHERLRFLERRARHYGYAHVPPQSLEELWRLPTPRTVEPIDWTGAYKP